MSDLCEWLHEEVKKLPLIKYPFSLEILPKRGVYFLYEDGEHWGHGGSKLRIVRVGSHHASNFRSRINEHFLIDDSHVHFAKDKPKPSDRSIFRKNLGRAFLNKSKDPYLDTWNIDFMKRDNQLKHGAARDIEKESRLERQITETLRTCFCFRFLVMDGSEGTPMELEKPLIGTVALCSLCKASPSWLGRYSPVERIRTCGLWLSQNLTHRSLTQAEVHIVSQLVRDTLSFIEKVRKRLKAQLDALSGDDPGP